MLLLFTLLLVTIAISAWLRRAGYSKKRAVFFAAIPWGGANVISLSAFMLLRTPGGRVISTTEQFLAGMILPISWSRSLCGNQRAKPLPVLHASVAP